MNIQKSFFLKILLVFVFLVISLETLQAREEAYGAMMGPEFDDDEDEGPRTPLNTQKFASLDCDTRPLVEDDISDTSISKPAGLTPLNLSALSSSMSDEKTSDTPPPPRESSKQKRPGTPYSDGRPPSTRHNSTK